MAKMLTLTRHFSRRTFIFWLIEGFALVSTFLLRTEGDDPDHDTNKHNNNNESTQPAPIELDAIL